MHVLNTILPAISTAVMLAVMLSGAEDQRLPVGTYLAFSVSFGAFFAGIVSLSETIASLGVVTIWNRVLPILAEEPEVSGTKAHPGNLTGHIKFDRVSFRYLEAGQRTLEDISFEAQPGECVAIAGPSGSGKTTILNLLLQFEIPTSGAIYLDGRDLADLNVSAVRRQLGVVNQDCKLIAQSIFENIAWGSLCTIAEAWEAAHAAAIGADIEQMPMGMHTMVSEGGTNLSGGQRQRLLIARALARKPQILILDEATSALDNHTQRQVTESLKKLGITRLIVAQRLSTIRDADRVYVIDRGRVAQCGTYEALAGSPGPFARLVERQLIR
jgi:ABC-type bacteriocin/lantibiotic exporter with double-glycine peptidase domain